MNFHLKKILKNIKYRQRNGGITRPIDIFSAVFSNQFFHCKKLKLIGNLSDCLQILTVGRLAHKQQDPVCEFFLSKYFYNKSDFCAFFLNPISKMFCNFSLKLNMANRRPVS